MQITGFKLQLNTNHYFMALISKETFHDAIGIVYCVERYAQSH